MNYPYNEDDEIENDALLRVNNMDTLCEAMRQLSLTTYDGFTSDVELWQVEDIVRENAVRDEAGELCVSVDILQQVQKDIFTLSLGGTLSKLAAQNVLECSWDDTINEPVFKLTDEAREKYSPHVT